MDLFARQKCFTKIVWVLLIVEFFISAQGYRWLVLNKLPQLHALDFNSVTKAERKTTVTWDKMNCWGLRKKKKIEEDD